MCNQKEPDGGTCPASNYVSPTWKPTCPTIRRGGAPCKTVAECGRTASGSFGGACSNNACSCYTGYSCPDCAILISSLNAGTTCPASDALARGPRAALTLLLVLAAVALASGTL